MMAKDAAAWRRHKIAMDALTTYGAPKAATAAPALSTPKAMPKTSAPPVAGLRAQSGPAAGSAKIGGQGFKASKGVSGATTTRARPSTVVQRLNGPSKKAPTIGYKHLEKAPEKAPKGIIGRAKARGQARANTKAVQTFRKGLAASQAAKPN